MQVWACDALKEFSTVQVRVSCFNLGKFYLLFMLGDEVLHAENQCFKSCLILRIFFK